MNARIEAPEPKEPAPGGEGTARIETAEAGPHGRRSDLMSVLALLALCGVTHFLGLGRRPLWDIDEGMHAATSRVIVESGDWIVPLMNGEPFLDKPILYNWLASLCFLALGFTELAARLPAAALGTGVVLLTWLVGRRAFGRPAAFLAGAVLATSFLHVTLSRAVVHDIALCACVTAALVAFHACYRSTARRPGALLGFWAAVGFSFLAKGPVGPVLVGLPIAFMLYRDRRWGFLRVLRPVLGPLLALAIALPWDVAMMLRVPDYGPYFFLRKNVLGFVSGEAGHPESSLFYVPVILVGALPWTGFAVLAADRVFREPAGGRRDELVWIAAWFATIFLLFSAAAAKLPTYVLPCLPPTALAVGWIWSEAMRAPDARLKRSFRLAGAPLVLLFGGGAALLWIAPPDQLRVDLGLDLRELAAAITAIFALSAGAWIALWRGRYRLAFAGHLGVSAGLLGTFVFLLAPRMDEYRSTRTLGLALDRVLPKGQPVAMWRGLRDSVLFYAGRNQEQVVDLPGGVPRFVDAPEQVWFLLDRDDIEVVGDAHPELHVVAWLGATLVISNEPRALPLPDGTEQPLVTLGELAASRTSEVRE